MPTTGSPVRGSTVAEPSRAVGRVDTVAQPGSATGSRSVDRTMTGVRGAGRVSSGWRDYLRKYWRILVKEIAAFGLVGLLALAIDLSIYNALSPHGWLKAKLVSTLVATAVAYFGNRYLSFSHRARSGIRRETSFFFGINFVTLIVSELVLGLFAYPLDQDSNHLVMNAVNLVTIALGTVFRFWSYKRFVFLHPDRVRSADIDLDIELAE
jgi:putative flippase GtrA